jgi:transcriptional regulator with XRE-family HTH domain
MPSDIGRGDVTASEIDQLVGDRIRQRRILMGLTQDQLGAALGISYQQVQKYETGANRVSAGRLYLIAQRLEVRPGWFFDPVATGLNGINLGDSNSSRNLIEFVRHFGRIDDDRLKSILLNLVRVLSEVEASDRDTDSEVETRPSS